MATKKFSKKSKSFSNVGTNPSVSGLQSHVDKLNDTVSQYRDIVDMQSETINNLIRKTERHEEFFQKIAGAQWEVFALKGIPFEEMTDRQQSLVIAEKLAREKGSGDGKKDGEEGEGSAKTGEQTQEAE